MAIFLSGVLPESKIIAPIIGDWEKRHIVNIEFGMAHVCRWVTSLDFTVNLKLTELL